MKVFMQERDNREKSERIIHQIHSNRCGLKTQKGGLEREYNMLAFVADPILGTPQGTLALTKE